MRRCVFLLFVLLAACQGYDPMPLDDEAHDAAWRKRNPGAESVAEYARQLAQRDTQPRGKFNIDDGISMAEGEVIALFFNPDLRVARLQAQADLAGAREAGRWEDPELEVDAAWILGAMQNPFIIGAGIRFTIPFSGRPGVEQDLAYAEYGASHRAVVVEEWSLLMELRREWLKLSMVREEIDLVAGFIEEVEEVKSIADRIVEAGELTRLDARVFELEVAMRQVELRSLQADAQLIELKLRELMGLHPDAEVSFDTTLVFPRADVRNARNKVVSNNPNLQHKRAEYQVSEQNLRLEVRKQYPDLSIGPSYELEDGQSKIGIGFGLPIPIINLNKEGIARARVRRDAVRAMYEGEKERLIHALARAQLGLTAAMNKRDMIEQTVAPLADEQIADARELADLGEFEALTQLDALSRRHEARMQVLEATLAEWLAREEVLALMGPTFKPQPREDEDE